MMMVVVVAIVVVTVQYYSSSNDDHNNNNNSTKPMIALTKLCTVYGNIESAESYYTVITQYK